MNERDDTALQLPTVSVVIPVKDGAGRLEHCLTSLRSQDYPSELVEVIVADGRSTDATVTIAEWYGATVVDNPSQLVSSGRNVGVAVSTGDYIVFTDDDCVLPDSWISTGVEYLRDETIAAVGGPTPIPEPSPPFSRAVNLIFRWASLANASVQSDVVDATTAEDLPGGNTMYRRAVLLSALPIDEHLITAEDVELHLRLRQAGHRLLFGPRFIASHHKRDRPGDFFKQMRRFAIGRVQVSRRHRGLLRAAHWGAAMAPWACTLALAITVMAGGWLWVPALAIAYTALTGAALGTGIGLRAALWFPLALGTFLCAWSYGLLSELLFPIADSRGK